MMGHFVVVGEHGIMMLVILKKITCHMIPSSILLRRGLTKDNGIRLPLHSLIIFLSWFWSW